MEFFKKGWAGAYFKLKKSKAKEDALLKIMIQDMKRRWKECRTLN